MKKTPTRRTLIGGVAAAALVLGLAACGDSNGDGNGDNGAGGDDGRNGGGSDFPTQSIDFILPSSPGGSTDLIGRAMGQALEEPLGAQITPVNRAGANGAVGGKEAFNQDPDGYTIVMMFQSLLAITPLAVEDPDPIQFEHMDVLGTLTIEDYVMVVNADETDAQTFEELIAQDDLSFGTAGLGTGGQLSQALLLGEAGVEYRDVPMDGGAPAVTALLGGQVDAISVQVAEAAPHIEEGTFTPLLTFNEERSEYLPDVPSAVESGYDVVVDQKRFLAAPAGLPDDVLQKYRDAIAEASDDEQYSTFLEDNYISKWEADPEDVPGLMQDAAADFEAKLDEFGITLGG
ncbi:tripartite tricarboxylate transporter substrate binding protein [Pseudactinotalea sp. Z1748]|uniref:tripartite tricarboxylate transporter substrate binding protein n=1 Tax=Pseudactinotalea sp. Z1748 TaxID=3413027 RepID=UPI003C7BB8CE